MRAGKGQHKLSTLIINIQLGILHSTHLCKHHPDQDIEHSGTLEHFLMSLSNQLPFLPPPPAKDSFFDFYHHRLVLSVLKLRKMDSCSLGVLDLVEKVLRFTSLKLLITYFTIRPMPLQLTAIDRASTIPDIKCVLSDCYMHCYLLSHQFYTDDLKSCQEFDQGPKELGNKQ